MTASLTAFCVPKYLQRPAILPLSRQLRSFSRLFSSTTMTYHKDSRPEYNWIRGVETLERYESGGFHPVMIGNVLHDRYCIVDKLGFGGYSTVWLARDMHQQEYVAVKVGIASSTPSREIKSLQALSASSYTSPGRKCAIPSPLDEFEVHGPNGSHPCYTMAPARCNLSDALFNELFPLDAARALIGGLTMAIAHMHSCGFVHGGLLLPSIILTYYIFLDG